MKAYGRPRYEGLTCRYGCCTIRKGAKDTIHKRRQRKIARRQDKSLTRVQENRP